MCGNAGPMLGVEGGLTLPLSRQSAHTFAPLQQLQNFYLSGCEK